MTDKALDDVRSVLTELLRLYDWRFELAALEKEADALPHAYDAATDRIFADKRAAVKRLLNQYGTEKKAAWEAARRVLTVVPSETSALTIEDKRWRILEHGCQWVSWTPIGGDTVSFDPRDLKYLKAMRDSADKTLREQLAQLRAGAEALARRVKK